MSLVSKISRNKLDNLIKPFGDIKKSYEEPEGFASAFFTVAIKE